MSALTPRAIRAYASPVAAHRRLGLGGSESRRTSAATLRGFFVRSTAVPMGRLCVGSLRARRFLLPVRQPAYSLPTTLGGVVGGFSIRKVGACHV